MSHTFQITELTFGKGSILAGIWIYSQISWSRPAPKTNDKLSQYQAPTTSQSSSSRPTITPTQSSYKPQTYPTAPQPSEVTQIYRDASGHTYSVPNSAYYRLVSLQSALIVKKTSLDQEEFRHESLSRKIESERLYLDQTSQSAVDTFNHKINQMNALNSKVQSMVDDYNQDVDSFNAELERVGTPIN